MLNNRGYAALPRATENPTGDGQSLWPDIDFQYKKGLIRFPAGREHEKPKVVPGSVGHCRASGPVTDRTETYQETIENTGIPVYWPCLTSELTATYPPTVEVRGLKSNSLILS